MDAMDESASSIRRPIIRVIRAKKSTGEKSGLSRVLAWRILIAPSMETNYQTYIGTLMCKLKVGTTEIASKDFEGE